MHVTTDYKRALLESKKKRLINYLEAEEAILTGQEYEIEGLSLTRADLKVVRDTIANLENEISQLEAAINPKLKRARFRTVIPRDSW